MRTLEEALASYSRTIQRPASASPSLIIRCAKCRIGYHGPDNCAGRDSGCKCMVCHGADLINEARRAYYEANTVQALRIALGNLLAVSIQRAQRARAIKIAEPVYSGKCACGCGQDVYGSPYGRPKRYASHAHVERASYRRRQAA
jgi:hypothetical protein